MSNSGGKHVDGTAADTRTSRRIPKHGVELTPENTREYQQSSDRLRQHSLQQTDQALGTAEKPGVSSSLENTIAGGEFVGASFGPVVHQQKLDANARWTQIDKQTTVVHHHHYAADGKSSKARDELSISYNEAKKERNKSDIIELTGSMGLTIFKDQKLNGTKQIYKGEKSTAGKPMPLAVKLISYSKQALREAQSLHSLDSHPNVVRIYDSGIYNINIKFIFIAMELCTPLTLYDYINKNKEPNPRQAIQHSTQIISGLEYIHDKGIAHRDLKPHNILFSAMHGFEQIKITDFGLAKDYLSDPHTTTGAATGTIGYMAPELVKYEKPNDPRRCDIFSLGIVLAFRLTNGKHPYGNHYWEWIGNIAKGDDPDLSQIYLPSQNQKNEVSRIITKMLQHKPENRPTARDLMKYWTWNVGDFVETNTSELVKTNEEQITPSSKGHRKNVVENDERSKQTAAHIKGVSEKKIQETSDRVQSPSHLLLQQQSAMSHSPKSSDAQSIKLLRDKKTARSHVPEVQKSPRSIDATSSDSVHRQYVSVSILTPGMFGVTDGFELVYWKDIGQLISDPTIITKLPHSVVGYSVVAGDRCIYLVKATICYTFDLDNADIGWIRLGSMEHDRGWYPLATVLNGKLYVCGMGSWVDASKKCEVFTGQWSEISSMKVLRIQNCLVSHGGFLYSIGGRDKKSKPLRSVEKYDPSTNTWEISQPMNLARSDTKAVVYNGKIYVWGGIDSNGKWVATCECFDPLTSTWTLSTSDWWKTNKPRLPFVFDNKVLSLLRSEDGGYDTIQQIPLGNDSETNLIKVKLPERWTLRSIVAVE